MGYILKQFDIPLPRFSVIENTATPELRIEWVNEDKKALLPLDLTLSPEGLSRWTQKRIIPRNRAYVGPLRVEYQPANVQPGKAPEVRRYPAPASL